MNVNAIIEYENGELDPMGELELFSELIATGAAWSLQGHYGRTAKAFIEQGLLYEDGGISSYAYDLLTDAEMESDPREEYTWVRDNSL